MIMFLYRFTLGGIGLKYFNEDNGLKYNEINRDNYMININHDRSIMIKKLIISKKEVDLFE